MLKLISKPEFFVVFCYLLPLEILSFSPCLPSSTESESRVLKLGIFFTAFSKLRRFLKTRAHLMIMDDSLETIT
jgi:hypothetical protein